MKVLAPLFVVLVFAVVGVRAALRPSDALERARIASGWSQAVAQPARLPAFRAEVRHYVASHAGDAEARWFAARAYFQAEQAADAVEVVWGAGDLADRPGTGRRFANLALRAAGFHDEASLELLKDSGPNALLALCDGGDAQAQTRLDRLVTEELSGSFLSVFSGVLTFASPPTVDRFAAAIRSREETPAQVVAAIAELGPAPYPERAGDIARLEDVIQGPMRKEQGFVWALAAMALGRSGDAGALSAIDGVRKRLQESDAPRDGHDSATLAAALVAGGRWDAAVALTPFLGASATRSPNRMWYAEAIVDRLRQGDAAAPAAFRRLWETFDRYPDPPLEWRVAFEILLRGKPLVSADVPAEPILQRLASSGGGPGPSSVIAAWAWRENRPQGREKVVDVLRSLAKGGWFERDPTALQTTIVSPLILVLRSLLLYKTGSSPH